MLGIFSFMRDIFDGSREMRLLSDAHGYTPTGLESSTISQPHLHLPEAWPPAQYLVDMGLRPALARRLSSTYMDFVDRYRKTCQSHFNRATCGGHLTEYYREVFVVLFRRTVQAWDSQIVSIARVQLYQAGVQTTVRTEHVNASTIVISKSHCNTKSISQIRVDNAAKAEIMARLGLKVTHLTSDRVGFNALFRSTHLIKLRQMVTSPGSDVTSRPEEVSEQTHVLSTDTIDSRLMVCSWSVFCA